MQLNDPLGGLRAYETAIEMDPKNIDALVGSGMALLQQNRIEAAIVQLENARLEKPDAPFTLGLLVQAYFLKGDAVALESTSRRLKAVNPVLAQKVATMLSEKPK